MAQGEICRFAVPMEVTDAPGSVEDKRPWLAGGLLGVGEGIGEAGIGGKWEHWQTSKESQGARNKGKGQTRMHSNGKST